MKEYPIDHRPRILDRSPITPLRRMAIKHLTESHRSVVAAGLHGRARADSLLEWRRRMERNGQKVSISAMLAKLLGDAVAAHPDVNAAIVEDELVRYADTHLGVAMSTGRDLVVPVIKDANLKTIGECAEALGDLSRRAMASKLGVNDLRGGTFTLSSIGMYVRDVTATAIVPGGQSGIVVAAGITDQPVVNGGQVCVAPVLPLSLTVDHRVVNGAAAGEFLTDLIQRVESCVDHYQQ
ncbi:2-oxo acid dehydrogenase subunit E2 [Nocardioides humi]|uniref:2-oxoacid dehydrogenase acyltransferase catalytic domain-containing protein n=1 Tax=Nocardioides humi TaxID=449461 RepID=A0ABN2AGP1_9ACTN|nr:2-oxo acid dehydrogenase subunit E2 [Nocardioides humi]